MSQKKTLQYSALTDRVYWIDGKGQTNDLPAGNFVQMMLLWLNEGKMPEPGQSFQRTLTVKGEVHWKITCERVK